MAGKVTRWHEELLLQAIEILGRYEIAGYHDALLEISDAMPVPTSESAIRTAFKHKGLKTPVSYCRKRVSRYDSSRARAEAMTQSPSESAPTPPPARRSVPAARFDFEVEIPPLLEHEDDFRHDATAYGRHRSRSSARA